MPPPPPPPPPPVGHQGVFAAPPKPPGVLDATLGAVQQGALGAAAALYNKVERAKAMTPEEKRVWTERGVAGLSLAATVGGKKLKVASAVTSVAIGCCGPASSASCGSAAAPEETQTVEVLATEEAGQPMLVLVDGREYTVLVPDGVSRGQPFRFEVRVPAVPLAAALPVSVVSVGSSGAASSGAAAAAPRSAFGPAMADARAAVSAARTTQQVPA